MTIFKPRGLSRIAMTSVFAFLATHAWAEVPMLQSAVDAGELPPMEERLPSDPPVVPVVEKIGEYGGTWRTLISGAGEESWLVTNIGYDYIVRWDPGLNEVVPNLAESWTVNDDATEFTFKLVEGVKWSDGTPYTTADVDFWWNHVAKNPELPRSFRTRSLRNRLNSTTLTIIDDYTFTFTFEEPHGLLLLEMASPDNGRQLSRFPAHYMKQFHAEFTDADALQKMVEDANLPSWADLFEDRANQWINKDLPTLNAWTVTSPLTDTQNVRFERNPYYWKVDAEGNQLPYLDAVNFEVVGDKEVMLLKVLNGEVDMIHRYINTFPNKAVLADNRDRGNYDFFEYGTSDFNTMVIFPNLTTDDERLHPIFNDRRFREALSVSFDRQELIDLVFVGQGEPYQAAPRPESKYYNETLAKQHTEYDPDRALELLAEMGYSETDSSGMLVNENGERLTFVITVREDRQPMVDMMEIIADRWRDIGIDAINRVVEKSFQREMRNSGTHEMLVDDGEGGLVDGLIAPEAWIPIDNNSAYGIGWFAAITGDEDALPVDPPAEVMESYALFQQLKRTGDPDEQTQLYGEILTRAQEQFYTIGVSLPVAGYGIVKNNFHNVPDTIVRGWQFADPGPVNPQQFFKTAN
ncbi:ABC transporter substrate-binding protein [Pseudaestuariivita rosea]|uniref:ABC transporter substrate-binding protein n=1 Tax=Pseudaestuariivita rosea TaxID=2763263 RepID=UPI001ABAFB48|nr:ABC transporter substrate-binding protein [Pseudaestuariivita rosea]